MLSYIYIYMYDSLLGEVAAAAELGPVPRAASVLIQYYRKEQWDQPVKHYGHWKNHIAIEKLRCLFFA